MKKVKKKIKSKKTEEKKSKKKYLDILLPYATYIKILKEIPPKDAYNGVALMIVYIARGIYQHTNQPHCVDKYVTAIKDESFEGTRWCDGKVARIRELLMGIGLIDWIKTQSGESYIKINYFPKIKSIKDAEYGKVLTHWKRKYEKLQEEYEVLLRQVPQVAVPGSCKHSPTRSFRNSQKLRPSTWSNTVLNTYNNTTVASKAATGNTCSSSTSVGKPHNKQSDTDPFDRRWAGELKRALKANNKIFRKVNPKLWTAQFRMLRVEEEVPEKIIKQVLLWYIHNLDVEYVPQAYSAKSFRLKFDVIANAVLNDLNAQEKIERWEVEADSARNRRLKRKDK